MEWQKQLFTWYSAALLKHEQHGFPHEPDNSTYTQEFCLLTSESLLQTPERLVLQHYLILIVLPLIFSLGKW